MQSPVSSKLESKTMIRNCELRGGLNFRYPEFEIATWQQGHRNNFGKQFDIKIFLSYVYFQIQKRLPQKILIIFLGNIGQHLLKLNENFTSLNFKQPRRVLCTNAVSQLTLLLQKAQSRKSTLLTISLVNNISWVAQFEVLIMKITLPTKLPELLKNVKNWTAWK